MMKNYINDILNKGREKITAGSLELAVKSIIAYIDFKFGKPNDKLLIENIGEDEKDSSCIQK